MPVQGWGHFFFVKETLSIAVQPLYLVGPWETHFRFLVPRQGHPRDNTVFWPVAYQRLASFRGLSPRTCLKWKGTLSRGLAATGRQIGKGRLICYSVSDTPSYYLCPAGVWGLLGVSLGSQILIWA